MQETLITLALTCIPAGVYIAVLHVKLAKATKEAAHWRKAAQHVAEARAREQMKGKTDEELAAHIDTVLDNARRSTEHLLGADGTDCER